MRATLTAEQQEIERTMREITAGSNSVGGETSRRRISARHGAAAVRHASSIASVILALQAAQPSVPRVHMS